MLRQLMQIKIYLGYIEKKKTHIRQASIIFFTTQAAFACSKLTIETLEQGAKYV